MTFWNLAARCKTRTRAANGLFDRTRRCEPLKILVFPAVSRLDFGHKSSFSPSRDFCNGLLALATGILILAPLQVLAAPAEFKIWAMEAHTEGRNAPHFDAGLEEVRDAVKALKFDTYLKLKTDTHQFKDDKEYRSPINDVYALTASAPVADKDGRYRMQIKITMASKNAPGGEIKALDTELLLPPDKKVLVRGLKLGDGKELVVVLSLSIPATPPGGAPQK